MTQTIDLLKRRLIVLRLQILSASPSAKASAQAAYDELAADVYRLQEAS